MDLTQGERTISGETYSSFMDAEGLMDQWKLIETPIPVLTILVVYLAFVLKVGPNFMEGKRPYNLKYVMRVYNILQVIYNTVFIFTNFIWVSVLALRPLGDSIPIVIVLRSSCSVPKEFRSEELLKNTYLIRAWFYVLLKILDLFDTVFMVLRKKNSHITFLRLYHHVGMVVFTWITAKYIKAVQGAVIIFINLVVHALMYTYYFFSTFESFKNYLWLKRHLTKLQLFVWPVGDSIPIVIALRSSCSVPKEFRSETLLKKTYLIRAWFYVLLKILDLFDTVFMVLRKKNSNITFLHLYHHVGMVVFTWISAKYIKAVQGAVIGFINLVVHALMYTYYFFSTFEFFKNYLWLKRHLTKLQLAQFVSVIVYMGILYYWNCDISRLFTYMWEFNIFVIFCLFLNFYFKSYISKSDASPEPAKSQ